MSNKYFVFGDVHSFFTILKEALNNKGFEIDNPNHLIILLGDAFDRGEESIEMYSFLKEMASQKRLVYIRGNHEDLLFDCVKELEETGGCASPHHYTNGTTKTVSQFLNKNINIKEVLEFIENNSIDYYELKDYIFVHGWVPYFLEDGYDNTQQEGEFSCVLRPRVWLEATKEEWERARWKNGLQEWSKMPLDGKTIVCGHWHTSWGWYNLRHIGSGEFEEDSCFEPFEDNGIIALDSCVAWTHKVNVLVIGEE